MNKKKGNRINKRRVVAYMKKHNLSKIAFCKLCGISRSVLNKVLRQQYNISTLSIYKICKLLNIELKDMFY